MMPRQFRHVTQHYHKSRLEWNVSIKSYSILSRFKNVFAVVEQSKHFMFQLHSMSDFGKKISNVVKVLKFQSLLYWNSFYWQFVLNQSQAVTCINLFENWYMHNSMYNYKNYDGFTMLKFSRCNHLNINARWYANRKSEKWYYLRYLWFY